MPKLKNDKHEAFCHEFIKDLAKAKSYMRVYPDSSYEAAAVSANELLKNPKIAARIDELKAERAKTLKLDAESVLYDLKTYLEADITDFMELTPDQVKALPLEVRRMVTGFKTHEKTTTLQDGGSVTEKRFELTFFDKKAAYEMVNKHIGFYEKDNSQKSVTVTVSKEEAKEISKALDSDY